MRPRQELHGVRKIAVPGDGPMVVTVQANDLGEHMRIAGVALRPRGGVPLSVAGGRQRVDREHLVASCAQGGHPRAAVGLNADNDLGSDFLRWQVSPRRRSRFGHQRMQPGDAFQALSQPSPSHPSTFVVHELDVVVIFSPVVSDEQQLQQPLGVGPARSQHPGTPAT